MVSATDLGSLAWSSDILIFSTLIIVLVLVVLSINQRNGYQKLEKVLEEDLLKLSGQEKAIKKLENDLRDYVMGGKSLREWRMVKQQIDELSELPSFVETDNQYILKIHLSMVKKDDVRVLGNNDGIKITIDSKKDPVLNSLYTTPTEIDPNSLKVTYKGNSLEIKADKVSQ